MQKFELDGRNYIELNNLLKVTGLCESGGVAKTRIADGQVKVDDKIELRKRCKIHSGQRIEFQGEQVQVC
ncbi:Uncharacterized protein YbcJ [hydrothermal vent metagenome]|uniref:Uncharacterized protein YbcJ n=1 Tax=hydrothermal vent metagenome TaxID=652676 RepID=A0A3B0YD31_9ZZZZ